MTKTCNRHMRDGNCSLNLGHHGRHSTVTFYCEGCGKMRRGKPAAESVVRLGDGTIDDRFGFCFVCVIKDQKEKVYYGNRWEDL